jgi:hypothetical protein
MVEMAMILPLLLIIVLGSLECGMAFDHHLTLEYATREGARTGSALANGGGPLGCGAGGSPNAANVDPAIIAAVERVLESEGSPVDLGEIDQIRIFKANTTGGEIGPVNVWNWNAGAGAFQPNAGQQSWPACQRNNGGANPDNIGVSLSYSYRLQTPLGNLLSVVQFGMFDRTIMRLNPTSQ